MTSEADSGWERLRIACFILRLSHVRPHRYQPDPDRDLPLGRLDRRSEAEADSCDTEARGERRQGHPRAAADDKQPHVSVKQAGCLQVVQNLHVLHSIGAPRGYNANHGKVSQTKILKWVEAGPFLTLIEE